MDRKTFDNMSIESQIQYINSQLAENLTLTKLCKNIGIGRTTVRDRAAKTGYTFSIEANQYVITEQENNSVDKINSTASLTNNSLKCVRKVTEYKNDSIPENNAEKHVITQQLINSSKNVINMLKWFNDFQKKEEEINEILTWAKEQKERGEIIDVPEITIDPEWIKGNVKTRSFTIYEKVLSEFIKFAKKQPFSQQDLMSMALVEYMKKYNR